MYFHWRIRYICPVTNKQMQNTESYFDQKGLVDYFTNRGKAWAADTFSDINNFGFFAESEIVRRGNKTWIPSSWVRRHFELLSASPSHALESYKELECEVIQWIPSLYEK